MTCPISAGKGEICATIEPLVWESEFFQIDSGKLNFSPAAPALTSDVLSAFTLTQAKIAADNLVLADALADLGFRLVEGEADLSLSLHSAIAVTSLPRWREATPDDIPVLRDAASRVFALSRFRSPWYQPEDSGRFYAQWIENAVHGTFDHCCLLVEDAAGHPQGWVTLRRVDDTEARIGLLGVWPGVTVRGMGSQLMALAETWCRQQGLIRLRVATQIGNVAALRLYLRRGATIESTAYWLYR
ncbi:dTDP-4-amino-4,6-dideoxy-D-galactose acyltransferase [Pectobacterium parmentieri]|uniref:dTDP-fucosamine acetyltransferase n=1 Tax=Pectobacterium parmentieri TaxID=1905730 RepID=A0A0H3IEB0_PECPM|nr:dTDP-4-amino-4,6-dideoxy-D-galactose acyltransferase [Pectobacterium parmentieri]AFI92412.1 TDP-D-fucosamine acetyltransferase [Pectobacterium parmentieri]AOR61239.1 TDP-D-fucosamine acetyltransferase [Pectobacterium parmentieri]AYH03302.1 dTDP-4-amino-4,6-dideoxy-D-galactose acyltransferase [Pectobacterium parmentieri]AYH07630.1 dTDP-4-amino-4,6-dideoxy-D-galactose acyltransferase [Pectobacterium parmentieri]AYH12099.1 dTDP-4-amino-4,6-dideoxy-D-galactose acyltransferase [Pectobacterium pa